MRHIGRAHPFLRIVEEPGDPDTFRLVAVRADGFGNYKTLVVCLGISYEELKPVRDHWLAGVRIEKRF